MRKLTIFKCRSIERHADILFYPFVLPFFLPCLPLLLYFFLTPRLDEMNGILGRKVVLYACRSIERHLQIAFFACRSIERHAKMAIVTCRSMERHLKMGMLACRSIGRHLKAWIRYRRPSLVAGTLAWIRYRRPSLVAGTLAWIRYRRPSLVAGKNMYKKVGNLKTCVDRMEDFIRRCSNQRSRFNSGVSEPASQPSQPT